MKSIRLPIVVVTVILCLFTGSEKSQAYISLLDGNLEINGFFKEQMFIRLDIPRDEKFVHKSNIDFWRTNFVIEGLYKLKRDGDLTVNLFGGFKYYYEKSPAIDSEKKRYLEPRYGEYLRPYDDDLITELYVDFQYGPLQVKVGKQIVVWGETNLKQTADIINPLDLRYGSPGTEAWEDIKLGLYMIRGMYQTELPGDLNFEFLFIPGDYEATRPPNQSTYQGIGLEQTILPDGWDVGLGAWGIEQAKRDEPGWNLSNWEAAFKIRGFTANVDWSVFYFNTINDTGTVDEDVNFFLTTVENYFSEQWSDTRVFNYKRYEVLGATFQTRFENAPMSEWRLEMFYYIGEPLNKSRDAPSKTGIYDEVERDSFGFGLETKDYFRIPYFAKKFCDNKKMTVGFTLFYEKIFNHDRELVIRSGRGHRPRDSHSTEIAWSFQQFFFRSKWMAMFTGSYNFIGKMFILPVLSYAPGKHWRFEGGVPIYASSASANRALNDKDSILLRVRYEF